MEVHAHTHTPRKRLIHYFWEFLMLFLAVFAGFLAENQREHFIENNRERQYIASLIDDLKLDSTALEKDIQFRLITEARFDTLIPLLKSTDPNLAGAHIYYLARLGSRKNHWSYNDRTIQQLRNSGNFRLIRYANVSDSILQYDMMMRQVLYLNDHEYNTIIGDYRKQVMAVFDPLVFQEMQREDGFAPPSGNPPLFSTDPVLLNLLASHAHYVRNHTGLVRKKELVQKEKAAHLIDFLKTKYRMN